MCRICKGNVGSHPMKLDTKSVATVVKIGYNYDVKQDAVDDIHPKHICNSCCGILNRNRLFVKRRAGAPKKRPVLPKLATFVAHSAECEICGYTSMTIPKEEAGAETLLVSNCHARKGSLRQGLYGIL